MWTVFLNIFVIFILTANGEQYSTSPDNIASECYSVKNEPQRCMPEFENAAYNKLIEATSTCGDNGPINYCTQTIAGTSQRYCDTCQHGDFSPHYLTDLHQKEKVNTSYWQSEPILFTRPKDDERESVNLTLHLGKAYDITYIQIAFHSPKPHSFAIYKKGCEECDWQPFQYYSATCRDTYRVPEATSADLGDEAKALCTSEYSDITPLVGGDVPFATLVGRPSAVNFDRSKELQDWVTATDIRITLDRLNTFGDEIFKDPQVLQSYWFAIADIAVGARCKCNGHASVCDTRYEPSGKERKFCRCQHNTAGVDCEKCLDFYNDSPWGRATNDHVHECKPCNCNGYSNRCYFDRALYEKTGHGGHCIECAGNRDGANCEQCKLNYYLRSDGLCIPCNCDETGSRTLQCTLEGKCMCKTGVTGDKCDRCAANNYDLSALGCKPCNCEPAGSVSNNPTCNSVTGDCSCKMNVEGKRCRECKPGFFNLDTENEFGCTPCFCYGHSSACSSAPDYSKLTLESQFIRNQEKWRAQDNFLREHTPGFDPIEQNIYVTPQADESVYFLAPERFLGDQRASYNHDLSFTLRLSNDFVQPSSTADIILESGANSVTMRIFGQNNPEPSSKATVFRFRLHENPRYQWTPTLPTINFMSILANLTSIKIRGTYSRGGKGYLHNFKLETAQRGVVGYAAKWVELCTCPPGYVGQFCESCAAGFRHSPALGGPFMMCIPCDCNGHASICDSETGRCICEHDTAGDNCELCAKGFYGNAIVGSPTDCQPCPCPNQSACIKMPDQSIACIDCPLGYAGKRCDLCADGYYGDPVGRFGEVKPCVKCECNLNVDANAVGNCNRTTGQCLKCIFNTAGFNCDRCLDGYYGDALSVEKGDCKPCQCYDIGTMESSDGQPICDSFSGQCSCLPHVVGRNCDKCQEGFFDILSGKGCRDCESNLVGSYNNTCDVLTGQSYCKPGVIGLHCDTCMRYHYGFSGDGCQPCNCDEHGSVSYQCDENGQCPCQENVEGKRCDRCKENKHRRDETGICENCPACYNLVQDAVNQHRKDLNELAETLTKISKEPTVVEGSGFDDKLLQVKSELEELRKKALETSGLENNKKSIAETLDNLKEKLDHIQLMLKNVNDSIDHNKFAVGGAYDDIIRANGIIDQSRKDLNFALDYLEGEGAGALAKAQDRSELFGQQSKGMSQAAQEARGLAEQLESTALTIKERASAANATARAANNLAKMGINKQTNITNELTMLTNEMALAKGKLSNVKTLAQQALSHSIAVNDQALDIYARVNSTVIPKVNATGLKQDAERLAKKADELKSDVEILNSNNIDMLNDLEDQAQNGQSLLSQANQRQEEMQDILERLDEIHSRAQHAVNETKNTFNDASTIHDTLKKFTERVQESRDLANAAIYEVKDINDTLNRADELVNALTSNLEGTGDAAHNARDLAIAARDEFAKQASEAAHSIKLQAATTGSEAAKLRDETAKLSDRVGETGKQIDDLEKKANENAQLTTNAKFKVGQAQTDASEAEKMVKKTVADLKTIIDELKNLPVLDDAHLDTLASHLDQSEQELQLAELGAKIESLKSFRTGHQRWIKEYQDEANDLANQVLGIENILKTLPLEGSCFKSTKLEP